jgi:hypothetical protein
MRARRPRFTETVVMAICVWGLALVCLTAPALAAPPTVEGQSFSNVGSSSATLSGTINAGGDLTSYRFEYGTSSSYGSTTPLTSAGSGSEGVSVLAQVEGLQPDTLYHLRVVAMNEDGVVQGDDLTLSTFPANSPGLPDGRGYEMVSPVVGQNANVYPPPSRVSGGIESSLPFRASDLGSAVAYVAEPPSAGGNGAIGENQGNEYFATRGPNGWTATDIMPSGRAGPAYQAFSSDLSVGIVRSFGSQPLAAGVPTKTGDLYSRTSDDGVYHPFFTSDPGRFTYAYGVQNHLSDQELAYAGASANSEHLLFEANSALTSNATDGGETENNLYDTIAGEPHLVNVLPDGTPEPNATFGSLTLTNEEPNFTHVVSADGSRIFWTDLNTGDLYVRENDAQPQSPLGPQGECTDSSDACTVLISEGGRFWTASTNGAKAFYTKGDLYEYDVETHQTTDLAPGGEVQGVVGSSEDGSYVYFAAKGALVPGAVSQTCEEGERSSAGCNLYLFHEGKPLKFIATLSGNDGNISDRGLFGDWTSELGLRAPQTTPEGHSLVFISKRSLTGYPSMGEMEVYLYDATTDKLACVSCNTTGESPGLTGSWLPISWSHTYQPRLISGDGERVFFDSVEPLVPQDTNATADVYEWERDGAGTCKRAPGCVYILSGGAGTGVSYLGDTSASGDDVFIITRAQFLPQDKNENYDLYDARVGALSPPTVTACSGTGCQGVPLTPPIFATPSSVTFNGVGNFPPSPSKVSQTRKLKCKRNWVDRAKRCVKKKSKHSHAQKRTKNGKGPIKRRK